jgi:PAS domain S-box-containing protein
MRHCLTGLLILLLVCTKVYPQLHFKHYGIGDGFSDNSVRQIFQDNKGFLWFGTLNGLNRYDGNNIKIYKTEPGNPYSLSYSRIAQVMEDSCGYIWLSTFNNEIQRFDPRSEKFVNLNQLIEGYDRTDMNDWIIETSSGTLWVIMRFGGLVRFREKSGSEDFTIDVIDTSNFLPGNNVNFVIKDHQGFIWIGTDNGLVRFDNETFSLSEKQDPVTFGVNEDLSFTHACRTQSHLFLSTRSDGLYIKKTDETIEELRLNHIPLKGTIRGMRNGISDDVLVVTENDGVYYLTDEVKRIDHFDKNEVLISQGENLDVFVIYVDRTGKFWITPGRRGITLFDPQEKHFVYYSLNAQQRESQGDDDKHIFFEDSNDDFWIGIYGGGLFKFDRNEQQFIQFAHQPENFYSLSSNYVLAIYEDQSKNLWVGTFQGGINKTELIHNDFKFRQPLPNATSNTANEVRSLVSDRKGRLWIGTKEGSIYCMNSGGEIIYTLPSDLEGRGYEKSNVYAMLEDNEGNLWIGSKGLGLTMITGILKTENLKSNRYEINRFMNNRADPASLSNNAVFSLYQDHLGQIWVGTYNGGLNLIENPLQKISFRHFVNSAEDSGSISDPRIRFIMQDKNKDLWIGTSNGLNLLKEKYIGSQEKRFIVFKNDLSDISSLSNSDVFYIHEDHKDRIWIATSGGGLNLFHHDDRTGRSWFSFYDRENGLPGDVVFSILEAGNGNLWLGTDNGLCNFDPDREEMENYIAEEGIVDNLFSESTCAIAPWKAFVFGQKSGFLSFFPDSIVKSKKLYPVVITDFYLFNERISPGTENSPLQTSIESTEKITLKYNQNYFSFHFSMLDFLHSERCQYAYYLEGVEESYNYVGNKRTASYTNIDPGKYIFRVKASNHEGKWNETPASLVIIITPPFWQRAWFIIMSSLLIISLLLGIYFSRVRSLKLRQQNLEQIVKQRTSEIEEKNKILTEQTIQLNEINKKLEERQHYIEEQSEELRAQEEELRQNLEEMQTTQEELERQIKENKKVREALEKEMYLMDTLMNNVPERIYFKDLKSKFIKSSKSLALFFGHSDPKKIYGRTDFDFFAEEHARPAYQDEQKIIKTGKSIISLIEKEVKKDGTISWVSTSKMPLKNQKGKIVGTFGISKDITDIKKLEMDIKEKNEELQAQAEELSEKNDSLRTLNITKDKFFSIIAHDLKNPFNAVLGFSEILSKKYRKVTDSKKKQYIDIIFDSVTRIYKLLENLLQWARSQTGAIPFEPEVFLLDELIDGNLELTANQINEKKLKIIRDYPPGTKVYADRNMINTVVRNLIANAIKFTENGEIRIKVHLSDHIVTCRIEDTGVGIPKSKLKKIFEIEKSKSTEGTKGESGTGLGLIICREFVEKNGGSISAESIKNKGSAFTVKLPLKS